jgi:hypothetical protein
MSDLERYRSLAFWLSLLTPGVLVSGVAAVVRQPQPGSLDRRFIFEAIWPLVFPVALLILGQRLPHRYIDPPRMGLALIPLLFFGHVAISVFYVLKRPGARLLVSGIFLSELALTFGASFLTFLAMATI